MSLVNLLQCVKPSASETLILKLENSKQCFEFKNEFFLLQTFLQRTSWVRRKTYQWAFVSHVTVCVFCNVLRWSHFLTPMKFFVFRLVPCRLRKRLSQKKDECLWRKPWKLGLRSRKTVLKTGTSCLSIGKTVLVCRWLKPATIVSNAWKSQLSE